MSMLADPPAKPASPYETSTNLALSDAAYSEADFPALHLARAARIVRRLGYAALVVLALSVIAMLFAPWQQSVRGEGNIIAFDPNERPQSVEATVKGRIAERGAGVQENAFVKKGQLLFRIEDQDSEYFARLERQVVIAQADVDIARSRLENAEAARQNSEQIVQLATSQITAQRQSLADLLGGYEAQIEAANAKLRAAGSKLRSAQAKYDQIKIDFDRQTRLAADGLASGLKQQIAEQKFRSAQADVEVAQQDIEAAKKDVIAKQRERDSKRQEGQVKIDDLGSKREKALAELAKAEITIKKNREEINQKESKLLDQQRKLEAQKTANVVAPLDGYVMNLAVFNESSIVKPGDQLCRIVPVTERPAVQIYVDGNDAPLVTPDSHVRLQFEGWPAVQLAGWPSVAVGTFGGKVALVDAADSGAGKFRVVIVPDESDPHPWPESRYLRQGVRANGWVLLQQVPLGYEVWRRMNGFPPALKEKPTESKSKAPKIKV